MASFCVILAAAGRSSRFDSPTEKKPFVMLGDKSVWQYSADLFSQRPDVSQLIVVVSPDDEATFLAKFGPVIDAANIQVVVGGKERADSVANALTAVDQKCDFVAIHDAARPCIDAELIESVFETAKQRGSAIPVVPVNSTVKRSTDAQTIDETVDRSNLYLAQTPQVFKREVLESMYANRGDFQPTDEAQLAETQGHPVAMTPGSNLNLKITTRLDLDLAQACLSIMTRHRFDAPIDPTTDDQLRR